MNAPSDNDAQDSTMSIIPPRPAGDSLGLPPGVELSHWTVSEPTMPRSPLPSITPQSSSPPPQGEEVFDPFNTPSGVAQYVLEKRIGRGGMGEVWEAIQVSLGRKVAVKRIRVRSGQEPSSAQALEFRIEAMIAGLLEHPNIVPVHDLGKGSDGGPLMAMKLVEGRSWDKILKEDFAGLEQDDFLAKHLPILKAMSQAVAFAHTRGIVHRDLKPGQVMVGDFGEVMLMDWGLALRLHSDREEYTSRTGSDSQQSLPTPVTASNPAGTPALMAPEQTLDHAKEIDTWTDVYLLGATLYWLLTGTYPHEAGSMSQALIIAAKGIIVPPATRTPDRNHPEALVRICLKALQRDPRDRHKDAGEFLVALEDYLSGSEKRARAREVVRLAEALTSPPDASYADFSRGLNMLEEAMRLWPDHPRAQALRWSVTEQYARQALRQGDLMLAKLQAESLPGGSTREELLVQVESALKRIRRRELAIRQGAISIAVLMLIIAVGFAYFSQNLAKANAELGVRTDEAIKQRELAERNLVIAREQGEGAFNVVLFFLDKLRDSMAKELTPERGITEPVADEIRHAIAGEVASPVVAYLDGMDTTKWPDDLRLIHGERMFLAGRRFRGMGRLDESQSLTLGALKIAEAILKPGDPQIGKYLSNAGLNYISLDAFDEAEKSLVRAVEIFEKAKGSADSDTLTAMANLAAAHQMKGRFDQAEAILLKLLKGREQQSGPDSKEVGIVLNNLGGIQAQQGKSAESEPYYRRALAIFEKQLGEEDPFTISAMSNVGNSLVNQKKLDEAEPFLTRTLAIRERTMGKEHPATVQAMGNLATLYTHAGRFDEAESLLNRVLEIRGRTTGLNNTAAASTMNGLAYAYSGQGRLAEAEECFRKAAEIHASVLGEEHFMTLTSFFNLGNFLRETGKYEEGDALIAGSLAMQERLSGTSSQPVLKSRRNLAEFRIFWLRSLEVNGDQEKLRAVALLVVEAMAAQESLREEPMLCSGEAVALLILGHREEALEAVRWLESECYPEPEASDAERASYARLRSALGLPPLTENATP